MDKNLFEQAKEMMMDFGNNKQTHQENTSRTKEDERAIRHAIQAAYNEATPEEKTELHQLEQQLDEKLNLH